MWLFDKVRQFLQRREVRASSMVPQSQLSLWGWLIDPLSYTKDLETVFNDIHVALPKIMENLGEIRERKAAAMHGLAQATSLEEVDRIFKELVHLNKLEARYVRMLKSKFIFACSEVGRGYSTFQLYKQELLAREVEVRQRNERDAMPRGIEASFDQLTKRVENWLESYSELLSVMLYLTKDVLMKMFAEAEKRIKDETECLANAQGKNAAHTMQRYLKTMDEQLIRMNDLNKECDVETLKKKVDEVLKRTTALQNAGVLAKSATKLLQGVLISLIPNVIGAVIDVLKSASQIKMVTPEDVLLQHMEVLAMKKV